MARLARRDGVDPEESVATRKYSSESFGVGRDFVAPGRAMIDVWFTD